MPRLDFSHQPFGYQVGGLFCFNIRTFRSSRKLIQKVGDVFVVSMFVAASAAYVSDTIFKVSLDRMGLGSMQVMSDVEGLAIRGMGAFASSGDHKKPELRCFVDQKERDHGKGFDHKRGDHQRTDKVSHKLLALLRKDVN